MPADPQANTPLVSFRGIDNALGQLLCAEDPAAAYEAAVNTVVDFMRPDHISVAIFNYAGELPIHHAWHRHHGRMGSDIRTPITDQEILNAARGNEPCVLLHSSLLSPQHKKTQKTIISWLLPCRLTIEL